MSRAVLACLLLAGCATCPVEEEGFGPIVEPDLRRPRAPNPWDELEKRPSNIPGGNEQKPRST